MSVFRNRSKCNCCPRQLKSYKEIKRKMEKLNFKDDWGSSKMPDPSIFKEIEADKHAYEVCCQGRKRKIKTPEKENLNHNQHEELGKSKSSLEGSRARLSDIYRASLAHKSFFSKRKPKWHEEHEKKLQQKAEAELGKSRAARLQNQVKKLEAQEKFQRVLEQNQKRSVRWRLEKEQELKKSQEDSYGQEKATEEIKEKPTPEQEEKDLIKIFTQLRRTGKNKNVLKIPLGKYEKIHKSRNAERFPEFKKKFSGKKTPRYSAWDHGSFAVNNKRVPLSDQFPKDVKVPLIYSLRENPYLHFDITKNKATNVGAKFSWNFRQMVKTKTVPKPKMSKPFQKLVKGGNVEMPESLPFLKSCDKIPPEGRLKKKKESKLAHKSKPNYGVSKTRKSERMPRGEIKPKYSEHFHKMLRGKEDDIPELNNALMSHHEILPSKTRPKTESDPNGGKPIFTKQFHKMLKGAEEDIPELNEVLMSQHEILPHMKRPRSRKPRPKTEYEPNYGVSKTDLSSLLPGGEIEPKYSHPFHETLRGQEVVVPELNEALMSHHEIFPKIKRSRKSLQPSPKKVRLSDVNESRIKQQGIILDNDFLGAEDQTENISPRSILKGKALRASHQMLQFKDKKDHKPKNRKKLDPVLSSGKRRPFPLGKHLKQFNYYIRNSEADQRIVQQIGSKSALSYLTQSTSLITDKSEPVRPSEISEMAENIRRPSGSVISTLDMAQSFLPVSEKKKVLEDFSDRNEHMLDTLPKDNQSHDNKNLNLKKTLSELMASITKTAEKCELKHRPKPKESQSGSERMDSSISMKTLRDEIRLGEIEALKKYSCAEQYLVEERAVVQARIQELMKYVVIREDFQPPKPPRDFIKENIEMLQKMQPRKNAQAQKQHKTRRKYPNLMEKLQMPEVTDKSSSQQGSDTTQETCMKKLCCRSQDQQEHLQAKPPAKTVVTESQKCETFVCTNEYSNLNSNYIEKTKAKKFRKRGKRKEVWLHEENEEEWCPKDC